MIRFKIQGLRNKPLNIDNGHNQVKKLKFFKKLEK